MSAAAAALFLFCLSGCGREEAEPVVVLEKMQAAREVYQEATESLHALRLPATGDAFLRLHAMTRSVDRQDWNQFVGHQNVIGEAERLEQAFRQHVRQKLPRLEQAFLESRLPFWQLDAMVRLIGIDEWEERREPLRGEALTKAAAELRIGIADTVPFPILRQAVIEALLEKGVSPRLNTGYGLVDAPAGAGTLEVTGQVTCREYPNPTNQTVHRVPERVLLTVTVNAVGNRATTWDEPRQVELSSFLPSKLVVADTAAAAAALSREALAEMAVRAGEQLAGWPALEWVEPAAQ